MLITNELSSRSFLLLLLLLLWMCCANIWMKWNCICVFVIVIMTMNNIIMMMMWFCLFVCVCLCLFFYFEAVWGLWWKVYLSSVAHFTAENKQEHDVDFRTKFVDCSLLMDFELLYCCYKNVKKFNCHQPNHIRLYSLYTVKEAFPS